MKESTMNKILEKAVSELKNKEGAEKEINKINELLKSGDKQSKREYIRSRVDAAPQKDINSNENKLKSSIKEVKKDILREGYGEDKLDAAGNVAIGSVVTAGAAAGLMLLGNLINFGTGGLTGVPLAVVISVVSTLLVSGIVAKIVANKEEY